MQSQQFRYKKLVRKVRVVLIDGESFVLLSDVRDTFQHPLIRFTLNGEPLGFALDDKYRPLEPLRILVTVNNNNDIIDCHKAENTKYNNYNREGKQDDMLVQIKRIQDKLANIELASQKMLTNTDLLIKKSDAILRQTFELTEYTIPRFFIVLPEKKAFINPANWWTQSYRLFFLCECENERHFAFHKGYEIKQVRDFFRKYGPYVQKMLPVVRAAIAVSSFAVPQLTRLSSSIQENLPSFLLEKSFQESLTKDLNSIDQVVENALNENLPTDTSSTMQREDEIQGVELREIESFLKSTDDRGNFGNLYRSTNEHGQVRWLCIHHYSQFSGEQRLKGLRKEFRQLGGEVRLDTAVIEESCAKRLEEMLDVICGGLMLFKMTLKNCKIRTTAFDKLLLVLGQQSLVRHVEFQDLTVSSAVGFAKTHSEIIFKLEEALSSSKHLTIQYIVFLEGAAIEKGNSVLAYFAAHSTERLSLHLYTNDIVERFSCSGLSDSDIKTIREWVCKKKLSWSVRPSDGDRLVFISSSREMKESLVTLTNVLLQFQNLHELSYYQTDVETDVMQVLGSHKIALKVLNFKSNTKGQCRSSVAHLMSMLKTGNISPAELSSSWIPHLVCMLKDNTSLIELSLPPVSCLHADDIILITEALRIHPHLCTVKIGCIRPFPIERSYNIFDHLLSGKTIEDFTCTVDGSEQFYDLSNALEKSTTLKSLHISVFNLHQTKINEDFCQYVARLPTLGTFSLSFDIPVDCSRLLRSLVVNSSLQNLSLTRVSNWQQLTNFIESGWMLINVSLCQCDIHFNDIEALVRALKSNPQSIKELSLSDNHLSDDSAIKLGDAVISEFSPLSILDLSCNPLSLACLLRLIKMLHFNTVLKVFDICTCLKRDEQGKYDSIEVQECKRAVAELTMFNEFVEIRWND